MSLLRPTLAIAISVLTLASVPRAEATVITASDSGWYSNGNTHDPSNENYAAGRFNSGNPGELFYHDFFVFDLTAVLTPVSSASLRLFNPANGYISPDPSETYRVYDVSSNIANLIAGTANAFGDLGGGPSFGSVTMSDADNNTIVEILFNPTGVAAINAALGGWFAVGGDVTTLTGNSNQLVFGFSGYPGDTRELVLDEDLEVDAVPEPGTMLLLGTGLVALRLRQRRS